MGASISNENAPTGEFRGRIYDSILDTIGATPLVRVRRLQAEYGVKADVLAKLEFFNPLSSVKDRIGRSMIAALAAEGRINKDSVLLAQIGRAHVSTPVTNPHPVCRLPPTQPN